MGLLDLNMRPRMNSANTGSNRTQQATYLHGIKNLENSLATNV